MNYDVKYRKLWNEKNYICTEDLVKNNEIRSQKLFCKKRVSEKILKLFSLQKRLGLKRNYLKRQGQDSGETGPA
jgi:hypothetical protein